MGLRDEIVDVLRIAGVILTEDGSRWDCATVREADMIANAVLPVFEAHIASTDMHQLGWVHGQEDERARIAAVLADEATVEAIWRATRARNEGPPSYYDVKAVLAALVPIFTGGVDHE